MSRISRLVRRIGELAQTLLIGAVTVGMVGAYGFLFFGFFAIGLALVLFGFNLDAVDNWFNARAAWFDWAGTILFKAVLAVILACCVYVVGKGIFDRLPLPGRPPRHKKRHVARARGGPRMARTKGAPRLPESGEALPGAEGGGEQMAGYNLAGEDDDKPMGCAAVIAAIVAGYFAYVGLVN